MRLRKKPWISEEIKKYSDVVSEIRTGGKWHELFGREARLHVELGTGKGRFINAMAEINPDINYLGIEAQEGVLFYAAQKAKQKQLKNLRLLVFDVNNITDIFMPGEVDRLYINFCDPWPKKRHAKRRLTHSAFLQKYRQILKSGGELYFKTDNEKLFEFSLNEFAAADLKLRNITFDLHNSEFTGNIMTEYEAKFSDRGMRIYRCEAIFST